MTSVNNDYHIPPLGRQEYYDLSSSQRRIWMIDQIQESSDEYLMTLEHEVYEKLDRGLIEKTLIYLMNRHETLCTSFHNINGKPKQKLNHIKELPLEWIDLKEENDPITIFRQHSNRINITGLN